VKIYEETKINQYLQEFRQLFICHRTDNLEKCEQYLSGLLHECKSNIERMVERVPESDYEQLQHFISDSPWDGVAVMEAVAEKVQATLGSAVADGSGRSNGLLLDESGWEKSGKKSVGVAYQYIGQVGKVANGQVGVFAALCNGAQVGLVQGRLYLPQAWVDDKERCTKAGIPEAEQLYRTKPQLAVEIIKTLPAKVTYEWVGGDSIYGNSPVLRQYLYAQKKAFVLDVGEELGVYLAQPQPYIPVKKAGRGRTPSAYVCDAKALSLKGRLQQIPAEQWQTITHRHGSKGPLTRKAAIQDVYLWKPQDQTAFESVQLLISTDIDGAEIKYSLCYTPDGKQALELALFRQMQRYWCERAYQNVKEQLGLHQYQVRSWRAWYHHIALTLMALHFVLQIQKDCQDEMPLLSVPDIKLVFAKKLLNKLNSAEGLLLALQLRHKQRKADIDRFSKVPK
jgi:SRSO17 transposase